MFCEVRVTKPAQAPKKTKKKKNKPLDAPNLHRHQKKQKTIISRNLGPLLSSCWNGCFVWFVWCLWMFGASSVFFGVCQCFVKSESPNLHRHQKKQKSYNFQELWVHFWVVAGFFVLFGFCWCLSMFGASSGFFCFFGAWQCFCASHVKIMMKKVRFTWVLDPPNA